MGAVEQEEVAAPEAMAAGPIAAGPSPVGSAAGGSGLGPRQRMMLGLQGSAGNAGVARAIAGGAGPPRGRATSPGAAGFQRPAAPSPFAPLIQRVPAIQRDPDPAAPAADAPKQDDGIIASALHTIPGYGLLTLIAGKDPITGAAVPMSRKNLVEQLLGHGPFAAGIGPVLTAMDILDEIFDLLMAGLAEHNLTIARVTKDLDEAWEKVHIVDGIDANVKVVRGYVDKLIDDVKAFATGVAEQLIEKVRAAAVKVAEPLLQRPEIAPIWSLAKKVMHYDPLAGKAVDATTVEILTDFLKLIGQEKRLEQMQKEGTLQKTADWLDTQFHTFAELVSQLKALFSDAWAAISPANLPNLLDTLPSLADRAFGLMKRVGTFAQTVITQVLAIIKDALLGLLSEHAHKVPGFHLMTVILGKNPFTGVVVPRTAENLIKGFITLMPGGEATYDQLAESGVIASAAARIEGVMTRLGITWDLITGTFKAIWDGVSLDDLLDPIGAFTRIINQFGEPLGRIFEFVSEVVQTVVELILKIMDFPSDLLASIIANAKAAITDIKKDPVAFLKNLLGALKEGVMGFFNNVVGYLRDGLANWLLRGLGKLGITIPSDFSVASVLKTVLEVLGLGIEQLWAKLSKRMGAEKVGIIRKSIDKLEGAWEFIKDVQEGGIGAIWKHITDQLGNLWDTILGMAKDWIMGEIVEKVMARLISMLDPTGIMAIVRSFQAFFNAIQSAVEYLKEILTIVNEYVSTLAQVAAGNIAAGAVKLEKGLASAIPVAIGFLANQIGLGNIPEKIVEIITGLREMVDKALDWLVDKAVTLGEKALGALGIGGKDGDEKKDDAKDDKKGLLPPVELTMEGEHHEFTVTKEQGVRMASAVPERLTVLLAREEQIVKERLTALGPDGDAGEREQLTIREREVAAMVQTATDVDRAIHEPKGEELVKIGLQLLRAQASDYGKKYRRGVLGGASTWGPTEAGTTAPWKRHKGGAGLEKEHVIPSAVLVAMAGMGERDSSGFKPIDGALTTLTWWDKAALLKTHGQVQIDGITHQLGMLGDNQASAAAISAMQARSFSLSEFARDRIAAMQKAAEILGIDVPTKDQIATAAKLQMNNMWELIAAAQTRRADAGAPSTGQGATPTVRPTMPPSAQPGDPDETSFAGL